MHWAGDQIGGAVHSQNANNSSAIGNSSRAIGASMTLALSLVFFVFYFVEVVMVYKLRNWFSYHYDKNSWTFLDVMARKPKGAIRRK